MKQNIFSTKNQLDEMQEQTLRKIESRGFWLIWWGLFVVMIFQLMMQADISQMAGEWIVLMAACLYTLEECLRNGIWDRHIKASLSTSIVGSLVGGVLSAVVMMFATHSLAVAGVTGVITVVFTFTLMQAAISEYKKRHQELENAPEETSATPSISSAASLAILATTSLEICRLPSMLLRTSIALSSRCRVSRQN